MNLLLTSRTRVDIILTSKNKEEERKMSDTNFNFIMNMIFIFLFTLILGGFIGLMEMNIKNVDKISEISNKVNVSCEVKTNQYLHVTVHKIVK